MCKYIVKKIMYTVIKCIQVFRKLECLFENDKYLVYVLRMLNGWKQQCAPNIMIKRVAYILLPDPKNILKSAIDIL